MTIPRIRKPRPPKRYPRRPWLPEDDAYLARWYNVKPVRLVARALKRTMQSIFRRACQLGITYTGHQLALTVNQVGAMLGIGKPSLTRRLTDEATDPIPHHRIGRYIEIYESELRDWLRKGNVLAFDRTKIDPSLHRMYDAWRGKVITTAELNDECSPLLDQWTHTKHNAPTAVCMMPGKIKCYLKDEVFAWAYEWGHIIPPWASPRFKVIRHAWDTEFIFKSDVHEHFSYAMYSRKINPYITKQIHVAVNRPELCARLVQLGMHDLAKRWRSTPIPWQELMRDYERKQR